MLTLAERAEVEDALLATFGAAINPAPLVAVIFGTNAALVRPDPLVFTTTPAYCAAIVTTCLIDRWSNDPSLLESLLVHLVNRQGIGALQPLVDRVHARIDPNPSEYGALWLATERPFFDRTKLRDKFKDLLEKPGACILRIQAKPGGFGRTYSREFMAHVAAKSPGDTGVVVATVSAGNGPTYEVADLALDLMAQLGVIDEPPPRASSSYPKSVARWILARLTNKPGRWIIVLDGFGQQDLNPEVRQAVESLAEQILAPLFRPRLRLVLTDYPQDLPQVGPADMLQEDLAPASEITAAHIQPAADVIVALRAAAGRPLPPADVAFALDQIVATAPAGGKERLKAFNAALLNLWTFEPDAPG